MVEETVWIPTPNGKKLKGLWRKPDGHGLFPAILLVPGLGMTMHEWNNSFDEITKKLNGARFCTLQFQFDIFRPDGSVRELPLDKRAQQFTAAFNWLVAQTDVDTKHVGILAQSYGVPTALSADMSLVESIVFIGGAYFPAISIRRSYEELGVVINRNGDTTLPRSSGERTTVGKEFWSSLALFNPVAAVRALSQPVLIIQGDHDTKVSVSEARSVFAAIASRKKKLKIFKGGDHGINDVPRPVREEFLQNIVD